MKLSVLITMYNAEKYIQRCLDSLLNQDISQSDYEIIVMNDGSTDSSEQIINEYVREHSNIIVYNDINEGPYVKRNKAIKLATGQFIYFVDADDYLAHNSLGTILNYALDHKLNLLGFGTLATPLPDEFKLSTPLDKIKEPEIVNGREFIQENRYMRYELWWYIIDSNYLKNSGFKFYEGKFQADVLFTLQLFLNAARTAFYPVSIYRYYTSPNSIMRNDSRANLNKIVSSTKMMVLKVNKLIEEASDEYGNKYPLMLRNLLYRRDKHNFHMITRMVKQDFKLTEIKDFVKFLKDNNSYPLKNFKDENETGFRFNFFNFIINRSYLLAFFFKAYRVSSNLK